MLDGLTRGSADQRAEACARVQGDKSLIALPLDKVRDLDRRLSEDWEVDLFEGDLASRMSLVPNEAAVERYIEANGAACGKLARRSPSIKAEEDIFTAMAHPAILGPVTSGRRQYIIDAVSAAVGLVQYLGLTGEVLDVGCHAGITTSLLAAILDRPVVGIDPCAAAIATGNGHASKHAKAELIVGKIPWQTDRRFDFVLSLDAMLQVPAAVGPYLRNISDLLNSGGLALIASSYWIEADVALTRRQFRAAGLGFAYSDIVAGYGGLPPSFEGKPFVVLVKGSERQLPRDYMKLADAGWSEFASYSNDPAVPDREKTQAFHRAGNHREQHSRVLS